MKDVKGEHPFGDAGQIIFIVIFLVVWALDSFFLHAAGAASVLIPLEWRLGVTGILWVAAFLLAQNGQVVLQEERRPARLISDGVFRWIRHPLYLASLLVTLGLATATFSALALAVWLILFFFYSYIAAFEERVMEEKFGAAYAEYKRRTGMWLPRFRSTGSTPPAHV